MSLENVKRYYSRDEVRMEHYIPAMAPLEIPGEPVGEVIFKSGEETGEAIYHPVSISSIKAGDFFVVAIKDKISGAWRWEKAKVYMFTGKVSNLMDEVLNTFQKTISNGLGNNVHDAITALGTDKKTDITYEVQELPSFEVKQLSTTLVIHYTPTEAESIHAIPYLS